MNDVVPKFLFHGYEIIANEFIGFPFERKIISKISKILKEFLEFELGVSYFGIDIILKSNNPTEFLWVDKFIMKNVVTEEITIKDFISSFNYFNFGRDYYEEKFNNFKKYKNVNYFTEIEYEEEEEENEKDFN